MTPGVKLARVDRLDCVVEDHDWEFDRRRSVEINAHWANRVSAKPALYDGRVLLARRVEERTEQGARKVLAVGFFETRFSRFLAWRDFGFPDSNVYNCFAMAALRSADGAFLLGEMGAHTANAGHIYFPAGTPDPSDARNRVVDLEGSLRRELFEETGIAAADARLAEDWTVVFAGQRIACIKIISSQEPASAILARAEHYLASEKEPELARAHMVSRRTQLQDPRLPDFIRGFLQPLLPE